MPTEIQWNDEDPQTGEKRFLRAEKFAGQWHFTWRWRRREDWRKLVQPTREMWEHILDSLRRRYTRRQGVSDEDIAQVEKILKALPVPRELDAPEPPSPD